MTNTTTTAAEILAGIEEGLGAIFDRMSWAEDEIAQAQTRHPDKADTIYHSFALLSGGEASARMGVEAVYRAHARETLERVATGQDTRPGTAVPPTQASRSASSSPGRSARARPSSTSRPSS